MAQDRRKPQKLTREDLKILKQLSSPVPEEISDGEKTKRRVKRATLERLIEGLQADDQQAA